jgi:peptidoglycan/xylan/chitin deacetylase (PgdA/CDA1 family)
MYHRVGTPPGDYTRELVPNLAPQLFEAQVRHLRSCYRLVQASELPAAAASRRRGERIPVAITFDDDLASHLRVAAPVLEKLGVTATFFLTGATLAVPFRFWWEYLQGAVDRGVADTSVLQGVTPDWLTDRESRRPEDIHDLGLAITLTNRPRREAIERQLAAVTDPAPEDSGLRSANVRALADRGFEIGFHTRRHDYLPNLDDAELEQAMHEGRDELAAAVGRELMSIAYPHGGADARVADAARTAGFPVGYTTQPDAIGPTSDPLLLGRIEAPFTTAGQLATRIARRLVGAAYRLRPASR